MSMATLRTAPRAIGLQECCERLGISYRTGKRRLAAGSFPIPALPRRAPREHHKFSTLEVDLYFAEASVADARVTARRAARPPVAPDRGLRVVGGMA
jgi:hypothetical protein